MKKIKEVENLEIKLLLEVLNSLYGYDFKNYSEVGMKRRIEFIRSECRIKTISDMIPLIIHDGKFGLDLIQNLTVTITEMFRDPDYFKYIRESIVHDLSIYPRIKIWVAGCSTGEEAYSIAMIMDECNLLDRCHIYATDINVNALEKAKEGIYPREVIDRYSENYEKSGGKTEFGDYFSEQYNHAVVSSRLKNHITFSKHNLVCDGVFSEMSLIICRNVFIYFNSSLQERVLSLFFRSLSKSGYLCLGHSESLDFTEYSDAFYAVNKKLKIYKKNPNFCMKLIELED